MKNKKIIISMTLALVVLIAVIAVVLIVAKPEIQSGVKQISVTVVHKDKTEKLFKIETEAEFLADAVFEEGLVTEEEYDSGYYTVVDGEKADFNIDKSWWCVSKDGEKTIVGMNEIAISDGESYEITYTID